ncbi:unnamed protein product [Paramecium sonneborni]|uniref:Dipeptidyl peptidase 3 n=1 Tax=Paramecium sonneborni TaxID=65129 RepID=A0A8S1K9A0_9CILI|nr:unnamed protein product [Paramecium sonneborni]
MDQQKAPIISLEAKVSAIECPAFNLLDEKSKHYAYYFTRACWAGAKICYFQRSYEAPGLFYLLQKIFQKESTSEIKDKLLQNEFTENQVQQLFIYFSAFFQNCGNYLSFGDSKFVPELPVEKFRQFLQLTKAYSEQQEEFTKIWNLIEKYIYTYEKPYGLLDLVEKGGSNSYYSPNLSKEQIEELDQFLHKQNLSELNTRVILNGDRIELLVASSERSDTVILGEVQGKKVQAIYGDFKSFLNGVAINLREAQKYAANETQVKMLEEYIKHFQSGDIEQHKESQKLWIQDKGPIIEINIGFIETYLDPMKVRAEYEGFVSIVNQEESKLLGNLVEKAEDIIKDLPWPKEFEIEKFSRPDFTSLEILAFACSGTPVGINIPNYDDIRQNLGFKNVNLGNVYGKPNRDSVRFLQGTDIDLFINYYKESLFVVVALHELIGHGSGKIFMEDKDGKLNFDNVINPFTNEKVTTFYKPNEHWHAKFGELSGAYEECRADSVALYLSTYDDVVQILVPGKTKEERDEIVKAAWLDIIMGALKGLQYYSAEQSKWGQPHILASYVILQSIIQKDPTFVQFIHSELNNKPYFTVQVDYNKIWTIGKEAIADLLKGLQVFKSIADGENGMKFFNKFTQVDQQFLQLRDIVLAHKQPRKIELQPDVKLNNGSVELVVFPESHEGVIQSHIFHYQNDVEDVKHEFLDRQQYFKN